MASERLTLTSNAHAIEITECNTQSDKQYLEQAMANCKVVLPRAFYEVQTGRPVDHADGGEVPGVLPAAASRWAVHWASNLLWRFIHMCLIFVEAGQVLVCFVHSSFGPALVWTALRQREHRLQSK